MIFDDSARGKIQITGADGLDLLHRISTNHMLSMKPFSAIGTTFVTDKGRVIDYVRAIVLPTSLLLITSTQRDEVLSNWINKYVIMEDIQLKNVSSDFSIIAITGSHVLQMMKTLMGQGLERNQVREIPLMGESIIVDRDNDFGVDVLNVIIPAKATRSVTERLLSIADPVGHELSVASLSEYHRILNGIPGAVELTDKVNPYEVNLRHSISFTKGCYIGQEVIARIDTYKKVQKGMFRLSMDTPVPQSILPVPVFRNSDEVGAITSITDTAVNQKYIALGVLKRDSAGVGDTVIAKGPFQMFAGTIEKLFE